MKKLFKHSASTAKNDRLFESQAANVDDAADSDPAASTDHSEEVKATTGAVDEPATPSSETEWASVKQRICSNYGIEPPSPMLQQSRSAPFRALAVIDIAANDGQSFSGWIASSSPISTGTQLTIAVGSTVLAVTVAANERPDINEFFSHPHVVSFNFTTEDCAAVAHPASIANALPLTSNNNTPTLSFSGEILECACVNSVIESGFVETFQARQNIEQFRFASNSTDKVNHDQCIALIAENIDLAGYSKDTNITFDSNRSAAEHYYIWGEQSGASPCSWFEPSSYINRFMIDTHHGNIFHHYLTTGRLHGIKLSENFISPDTVTLELIYEAARPFFDAHYYEKQIGGAAHLNSEELLLHYFENSERESTNPMESFSTAYYKEQNSDVLAFGFHPFAHYVLYGQYENRRPHPNYFTHEVKLPSDPRKTRNTLCLPESNLVDSEPFATSLKIGIHIHTYYVDELAPILDCIANIPKIDTIYLSTDAVEKERGINAVLAQHQLQCKTQVEVVENRGRDVLPLLNWLTEHGDDFDLVLHLHTKKSVHLGEYGNSWFRDILKRLVGTPDSVASLIRYFENVENIGIAYPETREEHFKFLHWGDNRHLAESLLELLAIDRNNLTSQELDFPAGNMFWFRPVALKPLFSGALKTEHFPVEPIDVDGTIAHAIERCVPFIASNEGFNSLKLNTVPYSMLPDTSDVKPTVSVIVPMYNCAHHLNATVESIINQGTIFSTLEVLLIDNNSSDNTLAIAKHYASSFKNIHLYQEKQQGAGNARNLGLDNAKGSYITFLDADDILPNNALEELYTLASANASELTTSRLKMFDNEGFSAAMPGGLDGALPNELAMLNIEQYGNAMNNYRISKSDTRLLNILFSDFGPCAKLYSAEFINRANLRFTCGTNYEDNLFVYNAYLACRKLLLTKSVSYLYRRNSSATQSQCRDLSAAQDASTAISQLSELADSVANENLNRIMRNAIANRVSFLLEESAGHEKYQATISQSISVAA